MKKCLNVADCTCFNLRKSSRLMAQFYDHFLQPSGLKNTQFSLLAILSGLGPISITELARELGMDRTTLTRNLKLVERDGLIQVCAGKDARSRIVKITTKGKKMLHRAMSLWEQAQTRVVESLGQTQWGNLIKEIRTLTHVTRSLL